MENDKTEHSTARKRNGNTFAPDLGADRTGVNGALRLFAKLGTDPRAPELRSTS